MSEWAVSRRGLGMLALAAGAFSLGEHAMAEAASGPVDEGMFVEINGIQQWIAIRGQSRANPVLLFLHGGPGLGIASSAPLFAEWEKVFTIVYWDQPGGGSTGVKAMETGKEGPLTIERFVADAIAVAEFSKRHLGKHKIALFGNSWGTTLGLELIHRRPELFFAYVGSSQAVGPRGALVGYEMGLQKARERGDAVAVAALEKAGPPPYTKFEDFLVRQTYTNPPGLPMSETEKAASAALMKVFMTPPPADAKYIAYRTLPPGFNGEKNFLDTQRKLFNETWKWDAHALGLKFKVPVFVIQGSDDLNTPASVAKDYLDEIKAPQKDFVLIPGAGHNTIAFTGEILKLLQRDVLPLAPKS